MEYIQFVLGLIFLIAGGEALVKGSVGIALKLRISTLVIGMTIVSFGTSAPELLVAIKAALKEKPDIAIGAVLGSNISNIALILGLTALIFPMKVSRDSIYIDWPVMMFSTLLFWWLIQDGYLHLTDGIGFVFFLIFFSTWLIWRSRKKQKKKEDAPVIKATVKAYFRDITLMLIGLLGLAFGSDLFIDGADDIAVNLGVPQRIIALTIVAVGTSMPELITSMVAAFRRQVDISVGNLIGSNIFNLLSILGITSIIKEIPINKIFIQYDVFWLLGITFLILPIMFTRRQISRIEGVILVTSYIAFIYFVVNKS